MYVLVLVERYGRSHLFGSKSSVTAADDVLQGGGGDLGGGDVEREYLVGEVFKGKMLPFGCPICGERGYLFWNEEAAIGGKAFENYLFERELGDIHQFEGSERVMRGGEGGRGRGTIHVIRASAGAEVALGRCV